MYDPERNVIAAMIELAIADMRRTADPKARANATVWLGSQAATRWFCEVDIDQGSALRAMGWADHAQELLSNGVSLTEQERQVLEQGVAELIPSPR